MRDTFLNYIRGIEDGSGERFYHVTALQLICVTWTVDLNANVTLQSLAEADNLQMLKFLTLCDKQLF